MVSKQRARRVFSFQQGFTALELLATIAVLAGLSFLTVSSIVRSSESSKRIQCLRNLREMSQASLMYAENDSQGRYIGHYSPNSSQNTTDDLNWLHGWGTNYPPGLISDVNTFLCPSARNRIRTNTIPVFMAPRPSYALSDLLDNAVNVNGNGHSYEVLRNYSAATPIPKTTRTVMQLVITKYPSFVGMNPGPSRTFLFHDAMEKGFSNAKENYPSPEYSHGMAGGNVGFADGHAEWIGVADWNYRWNLSEDSNRALTE